MYAKALEVDPKFTPGRVALGNVYDAAKKPEEALKEYESALQRLRAIRRRSAGKWRHSSSRTASTRPFNSFRAP
jgi:tetratricopeptide (TPR) repeat protein